MDELVTGIYSLKLMHVNVFFIHDGEELVLIDTGMDRKAKKILESISFLEGKENMKLKGIVISHHHIDHVAGLHAIQKKHHVPAYASALEIPFIYRKKRMEHARNFKGKLLAQVLSLMSYHIPEQIHELPHEVFTLRVIPLHGHTRGHVGFYHEASGSLFPADSFSVKRNKLQFQYPPQVFTVNQNQLMKSLKDLYDSCFSNEISIKHVFPSHGKPLVDIGLQKFMDLLLALLEKN